MSNLAACWEAISMLHVNISFIILSYSHFWGISLSDFNQFHLHLCKWNRADLLKNTKSSNHRVLAEDILTVSYQGERSLGSRASLSDHMLVRLTLGSFPGHGSALSHVAAVYRNFLDDQVIDAIHWHAHLSWPGLNPTPLGALCISVATDWPGCPNPGLGGDPQAIWASISSSGACPDGVKSTRRHLAKHAAETYEFSENWSIYGQSYSFRMIVCRFPVFYMFCICF